MMMMKGWQDGILRIFKGLNGIFDLLNSSYIEAKIYENWMGCVNITGCKLLQLVKLPLLNSS